MGTVKRKISWEQVEGPAKRIFKVWVDAPELKWAEFAWHVLEEQGLTSFSSPLEEQEVIINFLALGMTYYEFCGTAFQEPKSFSDELYYILNDLDEAELYLSSFYLGVSLTRHGHNIESAFDAIKYSDYPDMMSAELEYAVPLAVDFARARVMCALAEGLGSVDTLFLGLWNSRLGDDQERITSPNALADNEYALDGHYYVKSLVNRGIAASSFH